jgi:hypothetical protein
VHAGRYWTEGSADGWAPVLETLVNRGLARSERAEAAASLPRPRRPGQAGLGISHIKVSAEGDGIRPAKLYLGVDGAHEAVAVSAETPEPFTALQSGGTR